MRTAPVALSRIRWGDRRFSFSSDRDLTFLAESIKRQGLLTPPLLFEERGRLAVISGRRRLRALRLLDETKVTARIFSEEYLSPLEAWVLNFEETIVVRRLDPAEGCRAVGQLAALGLGKDTVVGTYLPLMGLPPTARTYDECLAVSSCGESFLGRLADGDFTLPTAAFLASLTRRDRRSAMGHLAKAPLTVSQQREWIRLVADITRRDGVPLPELLASASRRAARLTGRGSEIMQYLRETRFPALAERRKAFAGLLKRLALPPGIRIEPHQYFERDELKVSFTARSGSAFTRALRSLEKVGQDPSFRALLSTDAAEEE